MTPRGAPSVSSALSDVWGGDRWQGLEEEMRMDVRRLWSRNLGRDDRCIADHGKEVTLILTRVNSPGQVWSLTSWDWEVASGAFSLSGRGGDVAPPQSATWCDCGPQVARWRGR